MNTHVNTKPSRGKGTISARFRSINVGLFALVAVLISVVMLFILYNITKTVSSDYARLYSAHTVGALNTYFGSQITLVKKAARSKAVIEWFRDESNQKKKLAAYEEMMEIIDSLPSKNLYLGIDKSLHEFTIEQHYRIEDVKHFTTLRPNYYDDAWFFNAKASDKDYLLNVDIDKILNRKRVWLNYRVVHNEEFLGVLSTWLEFSDLVEKLFSDYDREKVRGLVIDEKGIIHMDSDMLGGENFLFYSPEGQHHLSVEFTDPKALAVTNNYLKNINEYFDIKSTTTLIEISKGKYSYVTIAPIANTTWSVVTFYDASSLFGIARLLPVLIIVLVMFVVFIITTSYTSRHLIFAPLEKLMQSIARIKANKHEKVYGLERTDEIGDIATTIQDMKDSLIDALDKVHFDSLTGIYNRRYLEEAMTRNIKSLSRSGGLLSVMMIDVDFFKYYNDTYGHDRGDSCLKTVATALSNSIERADDFVARYGGEEFAVVLPNTDETGARNLASKLLDNVRACVIPHSKSQVANCLTISIGVTTGHVQHTQNRETYIKRADEALYASKQSGRNKYTFMGLDEIQEPETGG